jgi:hypothetical protein
MEPILKIAKKRVDFFCSYFTDGFTGVLEREKLLTLVVTLKNHANLFLVIMNQGMIYSYRKYMYEKNITHEKQG